MIRIVLLGGGNIAYHLANHFQKNDLTELVQVYARNLDALKFLDPSILRTDNLNSLSKADVYILAISDDAISEVSKRMSNVKGLVLHTSGGKTIDELKGNFHKGVLYFPQSFTKGILVDFSKIPVCLEAQNETDMELLKKLASSFSKNIYEINSEQRSYLHVSAVFVNNFVNHLYAIGNEICEAHEIPFEILHPIILETAQKVQKLPPFKAQTGPAIRNDQQTLEKHKALLETHLKELYTILTNSIQTYGKKL